MPTSLHFCVGVNFRDSLASPSVTAFAIMMKRTFGITTELRPNENKLNPKARNFSSRTLYSKKSPKIVSNRDTLDVEPKPFVSRKALPVVFTRLDYFIQPNSLCQSE